MDRLPRSRLLDHHGGRHFASEPHVRIQVQPVPLRPRDGQPFFKSHHGELLILCLQGTCLLQTERESYEMAEGDQALLVDGEGFRVDRVGSQDGLVQLVWSPGNNPCRTCWEISNRFFGPTKG